MEHAKHRTCVKCGKTFEPSRTTRRGWGWGSVCPTCNAAFWGRIRKAAFWGGVTALASFLFFSFVGPGELREDFTPLSISALVWVIVTVVILLPGGVWHEGNGGGWGNGGGGNGGGNGG